MANAPRKGAPAAKQARAKTSQKRGSSSKAERGVHDPEAPGSSPGPAPKRTAAGLTPQQAKFAAEYLKDFNATQAAIRAGYSARSAGVTAHHLLKHPKIQAVLAGARQEHQQAQANAVQAMVLSAERTRLEIARLAYFDPRKLFNSDGTPKPIQDLDDDTAAALAGLDIHEEYEGVGEARTFVGYTKKYKIADKNSALEKAAKIDGLFEKDNKQKVDPLLAMLQGRKPRTLPVAGAEPEADDE